MIKCILVDDERKALKMLQKKIKDLFPDFEIIGAYENPLEALEAVKQTPPDLLFLDIAMPNMSGFDFLSKIENPGFEIIFVTAYNQYAIEAIKHAAIGYIVKPIDKDELMQAVGKAKENIKLKVAYKNNRYLLDLLNNNSKTISIPTQNGFVFVQQDGIVRMEGTEGYTKIVCKDGKAFLSSYSLGKFLDILKNPKFFQAHRSHVINISYVTGFLNEGYLDMINGEKVPLSKIKRKDFFELMEKH